MINKASILSFFRSKTSRPLNFRDLASSMNLSRPEARALKRVLRQLVREGDIVLTRKGLYGPAEDMNLLTGTFDAHRDGYGFVILEKPGERDIFVPARRTMGAMNNDRVIVRTENWGRREGRIIRILERAATKIVGRLESDGPAYYVRPATRAVSFDLFVSQRDKGKARQGDKVIAEIISFPSGKRPPSGKVLKVIDKPEDPKSEIEAIIEEFNLPKRFPPDVGEAAKMIPHASRSLPARKDLRSLRTVTIDGERARDFDDAVSIKLMEHGYKLWVHIADVGVYVGWNSAIDGEARRRATSVYFPDRVIPMLPKKLSEDLCSLKPGVERLSLTAELDFGRDGESIGARFYPGVITSNERMTYTSVRKILADNDAGERAKYDYLLNDLELMNELCNILRQKRLGRGSLDFDLPEPEVLLDMQGMPEAIIRAERNLAHMLIEEFMVAANEAVARHLESLGVPSLYRIHEEPDPVKIEEIMRTIKVTTPTMRQKPKSISQLLQTIKGRPEETIVNYMVLRSLKQARYSPVNVGHFGLASKSYTHFTSPIRRYPDLIVHRILREALAKKHLSDKRVDELKSILPDIAFHSSKMERLADDAEREVLDAMRAWFMKGKVGEEFQGMVTGITPYGIKIRLEEFYVEGFIHVSYMTDDFYSFDDRRIVLTGKHTGRTFRMGDTLMVRIDKVDMDEREIIFGVVGTVPTYWRAK